MALSGNYSGFMLAETKTQQEQKKIKLTCTHHFFLYGSTCFLEETMTFHSTLCFRTALEMPACLRGRRYRQQKVQLPSPTRHTQWFEVRVRHTAFFLTPWHSIICRVAIPDLHLLWSDSPASVLLHMGGRGMAGSCTRNSSTLCKDMQEEGSCLWQMGEKNCVTFPPEPGWELLRDTGLHWRWRFCLRSICPITAPVRQCWTSVSGSAAHLKGLVTVLEFRSASVMTCIPR